MLCLNCMLRRLSLTTMLVSRTAHFTRTRFSNAQRSAQMPNFISRLFIQAVVNFLRQLAEQRWGVRPTLSPLEREHFLETANSLERAIRLSAL